jgi:predicted dehydrogenase
MQNVNLGLIGCGFIAQWGSDRGHIPAIKAVPEARLQMVCDVNEDAARRMGLSMNVPHTTDRHKLLERKDIDAVVVAVPHKYHKEITIDACNAGKHVLCEKPLAMTASEIDDMTEASEKNNVVLMTAENYFFDPGVQQIKRFIDDGFIGKVHTIELEEIGDWSIPGPKSHEAYTWRSIKEAAGGGILLDSGIHLTAIAAHYGGNAEEVTAKITTFYPELAGKRVEVEDEAYAILEHEGGALSLIHVSGVNRFPYHKVEVQGSKGSALYDDASGKPEMKISGFKYMLPSLPSKFPSAESYQNQLKHFVDCLVHNKKPITNINVGRQSLELVLKAYQSSERNERVRIS